MCCPSCSCSGTVTRIVFESEVLAELKAASRQQPPEPCTTCGRPMVAVAWLGGRELARYCVACQTRTPPASR